MNFDEQPAKYGQDGYTTNIRWKTCKSLKKWVVTTAWWGFVEYDGVTIKFLELNLIKLENRITGSNWKSADWWVYVLCSGFSKSQPI